ncbi:hypothetical protein V5738_16325 [Salinisphaera sp. SPP-AMP-43]
MDVELDQVLNGQHPWRRSRDETTLFASVGLPFQTAIASGVEQRVDFLG